MPDNSEYPSEFVKQISETFALEHLSVDNLHEKLRFAINRMILEDFTFLVSLLYRLDVSERKLKDILKTNSQDDAGKLIAQLIIERQLEKLRTRRLFNNDDDIPDKEKW